VARAAGSAFRQVTGFDARAVTRPPSRTSSSTTGVQRAKTAVEWPSISSSWNTSGAIIEQSVCPWFLLSATLALWGVLSGLEILLPIVRILLSIGRIAEASTAEGQQVVYELAARSDVFPPEPDDRLRRRTCRRMS
jgi:hypothetical protein